MILDPLKSMMFHLMPMEQSKKLKCVFYVFFSFILLRFVKQVGEISKKNFKKIFCNHRHYIFVFSSFCTFLWMKTWNFVWQFFWRMFWKRRLLIQQEGQKQKRYIHCQKYLYNEFSVSYKWYLSPISIFLLWYCVIFIS